ncbi:hypothetical protein AN958_04537 [Leucoagaricus sp. SymC.cos]|nr:hypothetical protein AN958_04537 [Leucoagaricus sp. SymC.cos]
MSQNHIDLLMAVIAAGNEVDPSPFENHRNLYSKIDSIPFGNIPWQSFTVTYNGLHPQKAPSWMGQEYKVYFRDIRAVLENQLANPNFNGHINYASKHVRTKDNEHVFTDLMSGTWAWNQADMIAEASDDNDSAMFAPVVLGSNKTTVSVTTEQNDFYPLYTSLGNLQSHMRRAHIGSVSVVAFLAVPKTDKVHENSDTFRTFRCQLMHESLKVIMSPLMHYMSEPIVTRCADGHFRRVIYGIGPYIADYPEQCLLACVVNSWCPKCTAPLDKLDGHMCLDHPPDLVFDAAQDTTEMWDGFGIVGDVLPFTTEFPCANIHELLAPDLLHQIIKGTFKDHLIDWITKYITKAFPGQAGRDRLAELDRRIAAAPPFPGLRHFYEGRNFKQWTGDDSKGLMKVFLPALVGLVPDEMVHTVAAFLEFCYIVHQDQITETDLKLLQVSVVRFQQEREIFIKVSIRNNISLPRQHSLEHYYDLIMAFGAPLGLCSSITESKHIKAVKEPWRRSSQNNPLGEMLTTNQRLDKIEVL